MYEERNRNVQKLQGDYWRGIRLTPINTAIMFYGVIFIVALILFILSDVIFGERVGGGGGRGPVDVIEVPLSDIPQRLPFYLLKSSIIAIFPTIMMFFMRKAEISDKRKGFNPVSTQVCTKCNKVKADDGIYICDCGGEYILITKMKWVEPEKK